MAKTVALPKRAARARQQVRRYRFTPEQFHQMGKLGFFDNDTRYELVEGEVIEMPPIGPEHASAVETARRRLQNAERVPAYHLRLQNPLRLGDSELIPDLAVVPGKPSDYRAQHPTTALLVMEVADTTLPYDRGRKLRLYARHGIPEYWIVNLRERVLEVYREPERARYTVKLVLGPEETIRPLFDPALEVSVRSLFE